MPGIDKMQWTVKVALRCSGLTATREPCNKDHGHPGPCDPRHNFLDEWYLDQQPVYSQPLFTPTVGLVFHSDWADGYHLARR